MSMIWTPRAMGDIVILPASLSKTQTDSVSTFDTTVGFRITTLGKLYTAGANDGGSPVYTSPATNAVIPEANAGNYEVRMTSVTFGGSTPPADWTAKPGVDGSWFVLSANRTWTINSALAGADVANVSATFEIGKAGTSTALDSMTLDLQIDNA